MRKHKRKTKKYRGLKLGREMLAPNLLCPADGETLSKTGKCQYCHRKYIIGLIEEF